MPTKEEEFKRRFAGIMADVRGAAGNLDETLLLGSLAHRIISHAGQPNWARFKAHLSQPTYNALLTTFQNQGNALAKQGALRQVHAIEVLACSLIARTQLTDRHVLAEDKLLDQMIDDAIRTFRDGQVADPIIS